MFPMFLYFIVSFFLPFKDDFDPKVNYYFLGLGTVILIMLSIDVIAAINSGNRRFLFFNLCYQSVGLLTILYGLKFLNIPLWFFTIFFATIFSLILIETTKSYRPRNILYRHFPVLLERAARPVNSVMDGFTDRPYPAGQFDYDEKAVRDFANFTKMYLIGTPFYEDGRTILVLSNGLFQYFKSIKPEFEKLTYVSFSPDGSYNVHISRKDYKRYKDQLTFDELCRSLGEVVVDLYSEYRAGKQDKILKDLKDDQHRLIYDV
jgi:hypothetical protein